MLKMITDLINEHGSSTILRERLQLIGDKYDVLDEKNKQLSQKNLELETNLASAREEIGRLKKALEAYESSQSNSLLKDDTQKVLVLLFKHGSLDPFDIASHLSMDEGIVKYHLDVLKANKFARVSGVTMGSDWAGTRGSVDWSITAAGRKYVVEVIGE